MSLLRRKRRQNRLNKTISPATRETRFSLESVSSVRGLRNQRSLKLGQQREDKRLHTIIESPFNPFTLDFNREVKQAEAIHKYDERRLKDSKFAFKPLTSIKLDGTVVADLPPEHPICIQRKVRREMLFALGKVGKGGQRQRRVNNNIQLRCK